MEHNIDTYQRFLFLFGLINIIILQINNNRTLGITETSTRSPSPKAQKPFQHHARNNQKHKQNVYIGIVKEWSFSVSGHVREFLFLFLCF